MAFVQTGVQLIWCSRFKAKICLPGFKISKIDEKGKYIISK